MRKQERMEMEKAALSVQKAWLEGMEDELGGIHEEPPAGMKERLAQAYRQGLPKDGTSPDSSGRRLRRPVLRWAAAAVLMLLILAGSWLSVDKKARAEAVDWVKGILGVVATSVEAHDRLLRFLGGDPENRELYRNPKGEAWRPYYGGAWLNEEKTLVVALTDDSPEVTDVFRKVLRSSTAIFRKVKYSYDQLYSVYETIQNRSGKEPFAGLSGYSLDVMNNQIEIIFAEESESLRARFIAWLGSDPSDMVRYKAEYSWIIRTQEDQDLKNLSDLLQQDLLSGSRLTKLGDVEAAKTPFQQTPEDEVEEVIQRTLDNFPTVIPLDKQILEEGDLVRISYRPYTESMWLEYENLEIPWRVGADPYPGQEPIVSSVTAGRKVGETYRVEYPGAPYATDEKVMCEIKILYIYRVEPAVLNDEFVREHTDFLTVDAWRKALRGSSWSIAEAWNEVLKKLLPGCLFELDEERIREKADKAELALKQIREYLLVEALAERFGIHVSDADVQAYCKSHNIFLDSLPQTARSACEWRTLREMVMEKMTAP